LLASDHVHVSSVRFGLWALILAALAASPRVGLAQTPSPGDLAQAVSSSNTAEPAELTYNNRAIATLRATVLSRGPAERAAAARRVLNRLVRTGDVGPVAVRYAEGIALISVGERDVFAIVPADVDSLSGEVINTTVSDAVNQLRQALDEAAELRTPSRLFRSAAYASGGTLLFALLLWALTRARRSFTAGLLSRAERRLGQIPAGQAEIVAASRATDLIRGGIASVAVIIGVLLAYAWVAFLLRSFPYTRPWGESLRSFLWERLGFLALQVVYSLPELFTAAVILLVTRFVVRVSGVIFEAAKRGQISIPGVYADTLAPTRRIVAILLWLIGFVVAYPYLPGSDSEAFKGVTVFVGLMISLGSSSVVNQMMSGLTITYSRSLHVNDFVRIGDVEGTVVAVGALSTKLKTPRGEDVTIPNAVVVSDVTTNYSRFDRDNGAFFSTKVTVGYDTPWRQVKALLVLAAERTPGVRTQPRPLVWHTALQDFYVQYTLLVALDEPSQCATVLDVLHANILDAFNEYDVQIMSPNYQLDPRTRKTVPVNQWYAAPAGRASDVPAPASTDTMT
jgi:small-conductance mechanosensitive channel